MSTDLLLRPETEWKPRYHTNPLIKGTVLEQGVEVPIYNTATLAQPVKIFAENYLRPKAGFRKDEPLRLTAWQHWLLDNVLEINQYGYLRYQTCVIMLPRKNGKTFVGALLVLSYLMGVAPNGAEIYSAAVDRTQARLVFDLVKFWIEESPLLQQVLLVKDSKNTIINIETKVTYRALAADAASTNGLQPFAVICDEVHYWESQNGSKRARAFWDALTKGSASLPESQFIVISTAGESKHDSLLGDLYNRGLDAVLKPEDDDSFGFFCWEADPNDPPWELSTWRSCNPNIAEGLLNLKMFESALVEAKKMGFSGLLRYHLNIWSSVAGDPFMSSFNWQNALSQEQTEIKAGKKITAGFDASYNRDASSIVIMDYETGFFKVWRCWERPVDADENWVIPRTEVIQAVHDLFREYEVVVMYADRRFYADEIHEWRMLNKYRVEDYSQDAVTISGAAGRFLTNIVEKKITHDGGEVLTRHVLNAIADPVKAYRKKTQKSRELIDSLAASVMANAGRDFFKLRETGQKQDNKPKQVPSFFGAGKR